MPAAPYTRVGPGLPPLFAPEGARALILGSFPSPRSRAQGFYYGHPQNRFWPLMARLTGEPVPAWDDLAAKRAILLGHGLALWDVIRSCSIRGASDASIRDVEPNDLAGLIARLGVEAVFCNGATSGRLYRRYAEPLTGMPATVLPSTSPANAAWTPDRLLDAWGRALGPFVNIS
ncbi:MAG: DNA-deoxyinosine glycosylase [Gemmiger sp.]|uniref:DNA-deoxyinosine glycosylase n=1 Tax=Gemmiger sp. TaxID=2049027 RepID=UPI002E77F291|nr:DNA-deoxyinosine glycosylase [Gemmiger sp.]MEE0799963.1 DNA-deoxyinosine glycosylase [Gemmiger sp.]